MSPNGATTMKGCKVIIRADKTSVMYMGTTIVTTNGQKIIIRGLM